MKNNKKKDNKENKFIYEKIALEVIKPKKDITSSITQLVISIILGFSISIIISLNEHTVFIFKEILLLMNDIFIAFIAMELGAYAIFQALLKNNLVYQLYKQNNLLEKSNSGFLGVILLFWFCIMVNIILIIILKVVPDSFVLFQINTLNVFLCCLCSGIYFSLHLRVLFEVRNFAINLYNVFQAHNKISLLEYMEEEKE